MPGTGLADVKDVLGKALQHGFEKSKLRLSSADHHVQAPGLGFDGRARQRRIDVLHTLGFAQRAQPVC